MSAPLTIQEHIEELFEKDRFAEESWHVIFHDPNYGYARTESFDAECTHGAEYQAREYFLEKQSEGRRPKMFYQVTTTRTESVKVI